jgi:hypothetical protein
MGDTAYITSSGQTVASVKQYYGCNKNWAYVYVWQSFRDSHSSWQIYAWIDKGTGSAEGLRTSTGIEVWSNGTNTVADCTRAAGSIKFGSQSHAAHTDLRC